MLLDKQDNRQLLTGAERHEAEGLVDLLYLLRLRAEQPRRVNLVIIFRSFCWDANRVTGPGAAT